MKKLPKKVKKLLIALLIVCLCAGAAPFVVNGIVVLSAKKYYITPEEAAEKGADCILVLGAWVMSEGVPSHMLEDRILKGIELYDLGASDRILMSGDNGQKNYDEVNTMKDYAIKKGVPKDVIFLDHAGFSTYESMYRAKEIFGVKKLIVVTQEYHLYRAIYIARRLGLEVYGVNSDLRDYQTAAYDNVREFLARCKDFAFCVLKPKPTYLGEPIPIAGSASLTDDRVRA
ncbi:MAG: YdcF family protein [Oscillospiraceae bacterium]|jgi:vancomycin permeability regulator SanA|nr:YdcF family protein [Oscillospiraceae bacterium]